jgi:hypothetical protein
MEVKMPSNQSDVSMDINPKIEPYVKAMLGASGLGTFDAVTSVLFAITTHIDLEQYPILVYLGATSTGKTSAMRQLLPMCKGSKWIQGGTFAIQRNAVAGVRTAFVDEADSIDNDSEMIDLYTRRFLRVTGNIEVNMPGRFGWVAQPLDIFGATVMAKRTTIGDVALRSRAIIIRTKYELQDYVYTKMGDVSAIASEVTDKVKKRQEEISGLDRVSQTWSSVYSLGEILGMNDWKDKALEVINKEAETLRGGQGYEPSEAILQAIDILSRDDVSHKREDKSVRISNIVRVVKDEFALTLSPNQIREEAQAKGFNVGVLHGYSVIKVRKDLLDALLPE